MSPPFASESILLFAFPFWAFNNFLRAALRSFQPPNCVILFIDPRDLHCLFFCPKCRPWAPQPPDFLSPRPFFCSVPLALTQFLFALSHDAVLFHMSNPCFFPHGLSMPGDRVFSPAFLVRPRRSDYVRPSLLFPFCFLFFFDLFVFFTLQHWCCISLSVGRSGAFLIDSPGFDFRFLFTFLCKASWFHCFFHAGRLSLCCINPPICDTWPLKFFQCRLPSFSPSPTLYYFLA